MLLIELQYTYTDNLTHQGLKWKNNPLIYFYSKYSSVSEELLQNFEKHFNATMCQLANSNTVFITTPVPEMLINVPDCMSNRVLVKNDFSDDTTSSNDHFQRNKFALNFFQGTEKLCKVHILKVEDELCENGRCIGSINGRPIYFDGDHLSEFGNKLLSPMFESVLSKQ